jgi:hypothetical protein
MCFACMCKDMCTVNTLIRRKLRGRQNSATKPVYHGERQQSRTRRPQSCPRRCVPIQAQTVCVSQVGGSRDISAVTNLVSLQTLDGLLLERIQNEGVSFCWRLAIRLLLTHGYVVEAGWDGHLVSISVLPEPATS